MVNRQYDCLRGCRLEYFHILLQYHNRMFPGQNKELIDVDCYLANKYRIKIKPQDSKHHPSMRHQDEQFFGYVRKGKYKQAYNLGLDILQRRPHNNQIANFCKYIQVNMLDQDQSTSQEVGNQGSSENSKSQHTTQSKSGEDQEDGQSSDQSESDQDSQQSQQQSNYSIPQQTTNKKDNKQIKPAKTALINQNKLKDMDRTKPNNPQMNGKSLQLKKQHSNNTTVAIKAQKIRKYSTQISHQQNKNIVNNLPITIQNKFIIKKDKPKHTLKLAQNVDIPKLTLNQSNSSRLNTDKIEKQVLKNIINIKLNEQNNYDRQRRKTNNLSSNKKCIKLPWIASNHNQISNCKQIKQNRDSTANQIFKKSQTIISLGNDNKILGKQIENREIQHQKNKIYIQSYKNQAKLNKNRRLSKQINSKMR